LSGAPGCRPGAGERGERDVAFGVAGGGEDGFAAGSERVGENGVAEVGGRSGVGLVDPGNDDTGAEAQDVGVVLAEGGRLVRVGDRRNGRAGVVDLGDRDALFVAVGADVGPGDRVAAAGESGDYRIGGLKAARLRGDGGERRRAGAGGAEDGESDDERGFVNEGGRGAGDAGGDRVTAGAETAALRGLRGRGLDGDDREEIADDAG
jgi:hypothetical protein